MSDTRELALGISGVGDHHYPMSKRGDAQRRSPNRQAEIKVRMSVEERQELQSLAAARGTAVNDVVLGLITQELQDA